MRRGDGELEGGAALGAAEDGGPAEEPEAQRLPFDFLGWAEVALEEHAKVAGRNGELAGRFGGPKLPAAKALEPKLTGQFLDPVFNLGPAVVAPPDGPRAPGARQRK